ncbi:MAG TPA: CcmD family protein [Bacteroidia bacterium]|jgi:CcmD family protein|nr:CcmD family protein [Bacteroidia bacterium]
MNNTPVEMADILRQSGKIYVVIAVLVIIFLSIAVYLFMQDKKIKELENKLKEKNSSE